MKTRNSRNERQRSSTFRDFCVFFPRFPRSLFLALLLAVLQVGCGGGAIEPVDLLPEDMCSHCRMAISEKRYAAEIIDGEGRAFKFDDLACLARFVKAQADSPTAGSFVLDFDSQTWVRGEAAHFVLAPVFKTPMGGGMAAFRDRAAAEAAASAAGGRLLTFAEVLGTANTR